MVSIRKFDIVIPDEFLEGNKPPLVVNSIEGLAYLISVYVEPSSLATLCPFILSTLTCPSPCLGALEAAIVSAWNAFACFLPLFFSRGFLF